MLAVGVRPEPKPPMIDIAAGSEDPREHSRLSGGRIESEGGSQLHAPDGTRKEAALHPRPEDRGFRAVNWMTGIPLKDGVVAVLADDAGRFLFIRRGLTLRRSPGWWCFVGGEVEPGETLESAAAREVFEEVGLRVTVGGRIHESVSPNGEYRLHWFETTLRTADQAAIPCPVEVEEIRWLRAADGLRLEPLLPGLRAWLEEKVSQP